MYNQIILSAHDEKFMLSNNCIQTNAFLLIMKMLHFKSFIKKK